jgi:hypothetical protein
VLEMKLSCVRGEGICGRGGIGPLILNLGTKWSVSGQPYTPAALFLNNEHPSNIESVAGWAPESLFTFTIRDSPLVLSEV